MLTKEEIFAKPDRAFEDVQVPEWGGCVRVASLSTEQIFEFQGIQRESSARALGFLLVRAIVNENFEPILGDEDIDALMKRSFRATERLMNKALALNNLGTQTEEAKKNSPSDPSDGSPFGLPSPLAA